MNNRREFIKSASLGSALIYASSPWTLTAQGTPKIATQAQIENQFLTARFDSATGKLHVDRKDGTPLLRNSVARADAGTLRTTSDPEYRRSVSVQPYQDALSQGHQLSAKCIDQRKQLDLEVVITLYDGRNAVVVETICRNASTKDIRLPRLEAVHAVLEESGECAWYASKCLTNGYLYADPGRVEEFGNSNRHAVTSMWNMGFYSGAQEEGLVIGYLENKVATGRISALYDHTVIPPGSRGGMSLTVESLYNTGHVLKPGASISSGKVIFNIAPDPFTALESYAQAMADFQQVHLNPIVNGWCSWYYTHEYINEGEILRNAEFAARQLKQYGLEYIQIDAGWYRTYGDWEGNEKFPHGMKWLAGKIRDLGLRPGIWLAPYCISEGTEIFQQHPDWLITDSEGKIKQCGGGATDGGGEYGVPSMAKKIYGLDITNPAAANWMHGLFKKVADDWGYDFIKIDFVEWTILSGQRYYDPTFTQSAAYRKGAEIIRDAIGPKRHLLDCGPMNNTVGLIDSTRIELDLPHLNWEQYTGNYNSNAPATAKRYYFNQKTWINDDDHLGLAQLTIPQARAAATIIALSGGTMISGDRLVDLDPDRVEILRKVYPSYGMAARPIDLFENDRPEIFAVPIKTKFGEWTVVALFNYSTHPAEKSVSLKQLRLPESKPHIAFDFWNQSLAAEFDQELRVSLEPESVALLSIHAKPTTPQIISTDRHFTQGALELEDVKWDTSSNTLAATSLGPQASAHNVSIYVPANYRWATDLPAYYHEQGNYSLKKTGANILRVRTRFEAGTATKWQVKFTRNS